MSPLELRVERSRRFIDRFLPDRPCAILDAGCGEGRLVASLSGAGHRASGIDPSEQAVAVARGAGRNVTVGDFLEHAGGPYDAIVFGSSLHHMHPLASAVSRAASLLAPGGLVLADEFDLAAADEGTARWFFDALDLLEVAGVRRPHGSHGGHERHEGHGRHAAGADDVAADPLERWRVHHEHDPPLATGRAMLEALEARFEILAVERVPYLYWYPLRDLEDVACGRQIAERLAGLERRLVDAGRIRPVGLRIAARKRADPLPAPATSNEGG